jgi:hypothetical protein
MDEFNENENTVSHQTRLSVSFIIRLLFPIIAFKDIAFILQRLRLSVNSFLKRMACRFMPLYSVHPAVQNDPACRTFPSDTLIIA